MRVSDVLAMLCEAFPLEQAESWDWPGLSVGDPRAEVKGIACALDALPHTVRAAHDAGCNLLVTHHPAFREMQFPITPEVRTSSVAAATIFEAARLGVSIVSMHTNLDKSELALDLVSELCGLERTGRLQEPEGFGALMDAGGVSLGDLAARVAHSFGCTPIIWGDESRALRTAVFCSGSLGSLGDEAVAQGIDCVITGEGGYHRVSELACAGVDAILLGHDASERPFAGLLARVISQKAPDTSIVVVDESLRWHAWAGQE